MTVPRYRAKVDGSLVEAIQFVLDDPRTHWHVNYGHPVADALQGIYWVASQAGAISIADGDWICRYADCRYADSSVWPIKADEFAANFEPVPEAAA